MKRSVFFCKLPGGSDSKESACSDGDLGSIPGSGWEDPLEKGMATHSSILAWRIPWTEEPGRLRSMGLQIVGTETKRPTHMVHSVNQELTVSFLLFVF